MTIVQIPLPYFVTGIAILSLLQWILALWIKARLTNSIQHEYDKKLEEVKFTQLQRTKAEMVAHFFAKWMKYMQREQLILSSKELIERYEELNRLSLELSLWIQDASILEEIMDVVRLDKNSLDTREVVGKIRKLIVNNNKDTFDPQKIILWETSILNAMERWSYRL